LVIRNRSLKGCFCFWTDGRERPALSFITVNFGHAAQCHERLLTGDELGNP
jgi:hypothetical protein